MKHYLYFLLAFHMSAEQRATYFQGWTADAVQPLLGPVQHAMWSNDSQEN